MDELGWVETPFIKRREAESEKKNRPKHSCTKRRKCEDLGLEGKVSGFGSLEEGV